MTTAELRGISRCSRYEGWHVYMAGPCFDTKDQAVRYRDALDAAGVTWWPQDKPWPARAVLAAITEEEKK